MSKEQNFINAHGIEAFTTAMEWNNGSIEGILIYCSTDDLEGDYQQNFDDADDIFRFFGSKCCAVVETGEFLINNN